MKMLHLSNRVTVIREGEFNGMKGTVAGFSYIDGDMVLVKLDNGNLYMIFLEKELSLILDGPFNIGDRVIVVEARGEFDKNNTGVIVEINTTWKEYYVKMDKQKSVVERIELCYADELRACRESLT
jgi:hypothetical protein